MASLSHRSKINDKNNNDNFTFTLAKEISNDNKSINSRGSNSKNRDKSDSK